MKYDLGNFYHEFLHNCRGTLSLGGGILDNPEVLSDLHRLAKKNEKVHRLINGELHPQGDGDLVPMADLLCREFGVLTGIGILVSGFNTEHVFYISTTPPPPLLVAGCVFGWLLQLVHDVEDKDPATIPEGSFDFLVDGAYKLWLEERTKFRGFIDKGDGFRSDSIRYDRMFTNRNKDSGNMSSLTEVRTHVLHRYNLFKRRLDSLLDGKTGAVRKKGLAAGAFSLAKEALEEAMNDRVDRGRC